MATIHTYAGAAVMGDGSQSKYHVMLATPVGVAPCTDYARSLAATAETLSRANIRFDVHLLHGCCHVDDARNIIIRDFLESACTDLFFIDADMGWQGFYVSRLLRLPGDIVAGVYCHKSDDGTFPFHPGLGDGAELHPNEHGLYEMPKVATGFMRIRRHVLEALYERERGRNRLGRPGDELNNDGRINTMSVARIVERGFPHELGLEKESGNDLYTSGDYVLSLKARSLGFKCFIYPDMQFSHTGEKVWTGHFGNTVRHSMRLWQPQFVEAVAALKEGRADEVTMAHLVKHYAPGPVGRVFQLLTEPLQAAYEQARGTDGDVLEFGSGLSTLVLGVALAGTNRTVHALEHDALYFQQTKRMLEDFEVANVVLHYAPLVPQDDGTAVYGVEELPARFGLALLDGPPERYGRLGVVKALADVIRGAVLVIDDADRHAPLIDWLRDNGHDVNIRPGGRWWALGTPKAQAMAEAAE